MECEGLAASERPGALREVRHCLVELWSRDSDCVAKLTRCASLARLSGITRILRAVGTHSSRHADVLSSTVGLAGG